VVLLKFVKKGVGGGRKKGPHKQGEKSHHFSKRKVFGAPTMEVFASPEKMNHPKKGKRYGKEEAKEEELLGLEVGLSFLACQGGSKNGGQRPVRQRRGNMKGKSPSSYL